MMIKVNAQMVKEYYNLESGQLVKQQVVKNKQHALNILGKLAKNGRQYEIDFSTGAYRIELPQYRLVLIPEMINVNVRRSGIVTSGWIEWAQK